MAPRKPAKSQKDKKKPKSAFDIVKSAAAGAAIEALGVTGAGKALSVGRPIVVKAARVAAKTGIPARVFNRLSGQQVMIHASPTRGLKQIDPRSGSRALPKEKVVYGYDPKAKVFPTQAASLMPGQVHQGSRGLGSVYVVKTPKRSIRNRSSDVGTSVLTSTSPAKVIKELPIPEGISQLVSRTSKEYDLVLRQAAQRAGAKLAKQNKPSKVPKRK